MIGSAEDREGWINRCNALEMALQDDRINHEREVKRLRAWIEKIKNTAPRVIMGFGLQLNHASEEATKARRACCELDALLKEKI